VPVVGLPVSVGVTGHQLIDQGVLLADRLAPIPEGQDLGLACAAAQVPLRAADHSQEEAAFLLTRDIGPESEASLVSNHADLRAPVLKVAHHGSRASTSTAFLVAVAPLTAVISVGEDNTYGLPASETLDRLAPRPVFRTDLNGDVEMSTDGRRLWVRMGRSRE